MILDLLKNGALAPDAALTLARVSVGLFFAISGWHKLFYPPRHAALVQTLKKDQVPFVRFNEWWVPGWEFVAGTCLAVGFLSVVSAAILFVICCVATCVECVERIKQYEPVDAADWVDDFLYLQEVIYGIVLLSLVLAGPTRYSIDYLLWR